MKRLIFLLVLSCGLALPSALMAQDSDHVEVGSLRRLFESSVPRVLTSTSSASAGAPRSTYIPTFSSKPKCPTTSSATSPASFRTVSRRSLCKHDLRPLTALFGPKFQTSSGPFRAYVTGKLGFVNFSVTDQNAPAGFVGALGGFRPGTPVSPCIPAAELRDSGDRSDCGWRRATRSTSITALIITLK